MLFTLAILILNDSNCCYEEEREKELHDSDLCLLISLPTLPYAGPSAPWELRVPNASAKAIGPLLCFNVIAASLAP